MEGDPLRIFGLLGGTDLTPNTAPLALGAHTPEVVRPSMPHSGHLVDGRFLIQSSLGQGAFGEVMRATDQVLDRDVAIKFLFRREAAVRERFQREAQTTASLDHPNVLSIHEFRLEGERPYIVYELIEEARTLDEAFRLATLPERLDLFEQALAGVAAAHQAGVVHRDLKPENILVRQDGGVRVADFGLARTDESKLTATGAFLGTPAYMAPEQVTGGKAGPASDVWSLGMILYEAIYEEAWSATFVTPQELLANIGGGNVRRPSSPHKALADLLFKRVLLKQPERRLPDAGAFLSALRKTRHAPSSGGGLSRTLVVFAAGLVAGGLIVQLAPASTRQGEVASSPSPLPPPSSQVAPLTSPSPETEEAPLPAHGTPAFYAHRRELKFAPQEELLAAAERGSAAAMRILGYRFARGWRCERDPSAAKRWWERAAKAGSPDSLEALAEAYRLEGNDALAKEYRARGLAAGSTFSLVLEADRKRALSPKSRLLIEAAVARGDDQSAARMSLLALRIGTVAEHRAWTAVGVALGSPEAQLFQVPLLLHSDDPDHALIQRHLERGRQAGIPWAYCAYGLTLTLGVGVPVDLAAAEEALDQAEALGAAPGLLAYYRCRLVAKRPRAPNQPLKAQEFVSACLASGPPYERGELGLFLIRYTRKSKSKNREIRAVALGLLRRARISTNPNVHLALCRLIEGGEFPSAIPGEAAEAARRAAELSWRKARTYGVFLLKGQGIARDESQGALWLRRAGESGDQDAWRMLGIAYSDTPDVPGLSDPDKALYCFRKGAALGNADAAQGAGVHLAARGMHAEARPLFEQAAKGGNLGGTVNLALCLLRGEGGPADPERACRLLEAIPSESKTPDVFRLLARCYREGLGVPADPVKASALEAQARQLERR